MTARNLPPPVENLAASDGGRNGNLAGERVEHYQQIVDLLPIGVSICDAEGRITYYNEQAAALWGMRPQLGAEEPLFCAFKEVRLADGTAVPRDCTPMARAIKEGLSFRNVQATVRNADGDEFHTMVNVDPIRDADGTVRGAINAFQDVSERKGIDAEIRRLAAIVESSDDAIISKDLHGIITSWNGGATRIFGYRPEEIVGLPVTVLIPPDRHDEEAGILNRIRRGNRIEHFETVRQRKDGTLVDVSLTVSPIKDEAGNIVGASKIARNIGRLKKVEEELRIADQRKNHFLATLAHELRGPLAPLSNALQVLRLTEDKKSHADAADVMDRQLRLMSRLIDDLLDVGRITSGKLVLKTEQASIAAILRHALEASTAEIEAGAHRLHINLPPDETLVEADPVRLAQVFSNLLTNAARYTPSGGEIRLNTIREPGRVIVTVSDNGIGIPAEKISDIFELFTQVEGALETSSRGLGIGLTLARQLVEMHQGTIEAHSDGPGTGSRFTVSIPTINAAPRPHEQNPPPSPGGTPARRVLVVDDNVDSAQSLAMIMKILGHDARVVHDGLAAVAAAEEFVPEIILMDIGMPKLDGYEACSRIRTLSAKPRPFMIALTGWGQEEDRRRCREAGFDLHLVKPIDAQTLIRALESPTTDTQ
jgi:PAS domain S-box